jgi:hypothetical protein
MILLAIVSGLALASCGGGARNIPVDDCVHRTFCDKSGRPL